jgi:hypothetical protein
MTYKLSQTEFKINSFSTDAGIEKVMSVKKIQSNNPAKNIGVNQTTKIIDSTNKSNTGILTTYTLASLGVDTEGNTEIIPPIPVTDGLIARYNAESFDVATQTWSDIVGSYDANVVRGTIGVKTSSVGGDTVVYGSSADGIRFPSGILPSTFTLFHITRYSSTTQERIITGYNNNWLDGHHGGDAGVAFHGGWLTDETDRYDQAWVLSASQNSLYRAEGNTIGTSGGNASTALSVNHGSIAQYSDWEIIEIVVYNRHLTAEEYQSVEGWLAALYPNSTTVVGAAGNLIGLTALDLISTQPIEYPGDSSADHNIGRLDTTPKYFRIESIEDPDVLVNRTVYTLTSNKAVFEFNTRAEGDSDSGVVGGGGSGGEVVSSGPTQVWY